MAEETAPEVTELVDAVAAMIPADDPWLAEAETALDLYWATRLAREGKNRNWCQYHHCCKPATRAVTIQPHLGMRPFGPTLEHTFCDGHWGPDRLGYVGERRLGQP